MMNANQPNLLKPPPSSTTISTIPSTSTARGSSATARPSNPSIQLERPSLLPEGPPPIRSKSVPHLAHTPLVKHGKPPPQRTVEVDHHHHHVIPVDSETDLTKINIPESKVNYLPYYPPVAVSQTGLVQAVGKPFFTKHHAKNLPDPGYEFIVTRRASQVRLKHVLLLGDVNVEVVEGLAKTVKLFSVLIGIAGLVFFLFMVGIAAINSPLEYVTYFLDGNAFFKAIYVFGVVQPIAVAPYCRYALINLKHIRGYFLRVPLAQVFPAAVIICSLVQFTECVKPDGGLKQFLELRMSQYYSDQYAATIARSTWNGIQELFGCCGYENFRDWVKYNQTHLPNSCCTSVANCTLVSEDLQKKGCKEGYLGVNISLAFTFSIFGAVIMIVEILSVVFMRSLYGCIGKELYDERSSLKIMLGRLCSLCDVVDTDAELEYDEADEASDQDEAFKPRKHSVKIGLPSKVEPGPTPSSLSTSRSSIVSTSTHSHPVPGRDNEVGPLLPMYKQHA